MKKFATFLMTTILVATPLFAASRSASLTVSVEVVARTIMTVDSQPAAVEVTSMDVARGYVDLPQSVLFHVRSNAAGGYTVQFEPVTGAFNRADINWGNTQATVGADGAWLAQRYQATTTNGALSVRLTLAPGTQPGSYPFPVRFDALTAF